MGGKWVQWTHKKVKEKKRQGHGQFGSGLGESWWDEVWELSKAGLSLSWNNPTGKTHLWKLMSKWWKEHKTDKWETYCSSTATNCWGTWGTALHCVNWETRGLDMFSHFTSSEQVQAFLTYTTLTQAPDGKADFGRAAVAKARQKLHFPARLPPWTLSFCQKCQKKVESNADQLTCIFQILVSSSKDSLLPKSSIIPFIRSQYWAWSMLPRRRDTQETEQWTLTF